ncbi:sulfite exporter TauE/SafE family protein [bacterium]|nr:sulfite exporter TauE/SafE family protein [bacterium]
MQSTLFISLAGILAFALSAFCGGGAGLILLPLLGLALPTAQVPAALSLGTASSSLSRLYLFRKSIHWGLSRRFIPAALPACWLGVFMLSRLEPVYLELALSLFLLSNVSLLWPRQSEAFRADQSPESWRAVAIGAAAGFLSGLTGAVGVLFNGFYFRCGLSKEQIVATRASNEIWLHLLKLYLYWRYGLLSVECLRIGLAIAVSALAANFLVKSWLGRFSEAAFRRLGYAAMVVSGYFMMAGCLHKLEARAGLQHNQEGHLEAKLEWRRSRFIEVDFQEFEIEQNLFQPQKRS